MKELYIHIGTGKTGTSAIQDFFFINDDKFSELGLEYVKAGRINNNHHLLCFNFFRREKDYSRVYEAVEALKVEITNSDSSRFLVSSEYFPDVTADEVDWYIKQFEGVCQIKIIVYFRRPDEFVESWFAQAFKAGNLSISFKQLQLRLIQDKILNYRFHIEKWAKRIGSNNVYVRPYQKKQLYNQNVIEDFLRLFEMQDSFKDMKKSKRHVNPSTSAQQIAFIQTLLPYIDSSILSKLTTPMPSEKKISLKILSSFDRKMIFHVCAPTLHFLNKQYSNNKHFFDMQIDDSVEEAKSTQISQDFLKAFVSFAEQRLEGSEYDAFFLGCINYFEADLSEKVSTVHKKVDLINDVLSPHAEGSERLKSEREQLKHKLLEI